MLLVDGNTRISVAIKYLTQSTWSHAALYVGDALAVPDNADDPPALIEADMVEGVWAVPVSKYAALHTRICRPFALTPEDAKRVPGPPSPLSRVVRTVPGSHSVVVVKSAR